MSNFSLSLAALSTPFLFVACGGGGGGEGAQPPPPAEDPAGGPLSMYVARADSSSTGIVQRVDEAFDPSATFEVGGNRGVDLDYFGNLYQVGFGAGGAALRVFSRARERSDLSAFSPALDRTISGPASGLEIPIAVQVAHRRGIVLVVNLGSNNILAFGAQGADTIGRPVEPLGTTPLEEFGAPLDLFLDERSDQLYVLFSDFTVGIIPSYLSNDFSSAGLRVVELLDEGGERIEGLSTALVYDREGDRLVVAGSGDSGVEDDGSIHIFQGAAVSSDSLLATRVISGPSTLLGDPDDLVLDGDRLRVAESVNGGGRLLAFNDVFSGTASDVAPDLNVATDSPSAMVMEPALPEYAPDATDSVEPNQVGRILFSEGGIIKSLSYPDLVEAPGSFASRLGTYLPIQALDLDVLGNVYVAGSEGSQGQLEILGGLAKNRLAPVHQSNLDRIQSLGFESLGPQAIDVIGRLGLVVVGDRGSAFGTPRILVNSIGGQAAAPLFVVPLPVSPTSLDYDEESDRLYVSLFDGRVAVIDDLLRGATPPQGVDRFFTVEEPLGSGLPLAGSLRGLVYDAANDFVIVCGEDGTPTNSAGKVYLIEEASAADGIAPAKVRLSGPSDPIAIAYDGSSLFVSDRVNLTVSRFDDFANLDTSVSTFVPPDASVSATANALLLVPEGLAPIEGGSILGD